MILLKSSLSGERKIIDNMEVNRDYVSMTSQTMRINRNQRISKIIKTRERNLFKRYYVNVQRSLNPVRDQFDSLERKKYFTTLHLKDSFFHISCFFKMHEDSKVYLACHHFSVMSSGQYEYMKMNGLKGIPQNSNIILYKSLLIDRPRF